MKKKHNTLHALWSPPNIGVRTQRWPDISPTVRTNGLYTQNEQAAVYKTSSLHTMQGQAEGKALNQGLGPVVFFGYAAVGVCVGEP